jgi:hypothetical protein
VILEKSQEDMNTRQLLIELCVSHIAQKYKQQLSLSKKYLEYRLPKLKYKGTMQQQRVRGKKDPKIQVIDKEVFETPAESTRVPPWKLTLDGQDLHVEDLRCFHLFLLEVDLELLVSGKSINLRCGEERIEVTVGRIYHLSLWTPFLIDVFTVTARFDCKTRKLMIQGQRKKEIIQVEKSSTRLTPVSLSENELLFDVV